jgi:CheY-like chemotaxis protein
LVGTSAAQIGFLPMAANLDRTIILVVEDELFVRMVAADLLAEDDRVVLEASCAEEALAVIDAQDRIDLLFTDVNMPGEMNGLDLAAVAHRRQPHMKLIVTSGAKQMADDEIPDHGIFISKPYPARILVELVQTKLADDS